MGTRPYLSMGSIYRDEADSLPEWIEFHRLVGVERFFLYDNFSSDSHREVLAPYVKDDIVVLHDWPVKFPASYGSAFNHCLREHGHESRWIAFVDIDEFLFSPTLRPLPELLPEYEQWPAVCPLSVWFGTSGHATQPPGLVIENFLYRWELEQSPIKTILDPSRTRRCHSAHRFAYHDGLPVDENHVPIEGWAPTSKSAEKLRINHYWLKSEEAAERKLEARAHTDRPIPRGWFDRRRVLLNKVRDETILPYVPPLREALAQRGD